MKLQLYTNNDGLKKKKKTYKQTNKLCKKKKSE